MTDCGIGTNDPDVPASGSCKEQYLFHLEFYVRQIQCPRLAKLNQMFCVPTCVKFCFLDFRQDEELQLTPVDPMFEPQSGIADDVEYFYSGRSVLFGLSQEAVADVCRDFKINICVCKRMPRDIKPDIVIGKAELDMSMHFAALRKEMIETARYANAELTNPTKCMECDELPITFEGELVGCMGVFARISGCGQTIVTEFEAPQLESASSFLFKAGEMNECDAKGLSYKCRTLDPEKCDISLSEDDSKNCMICKPPKLPCAPCRIGSGARVIGKPNPCGKERTPAKSEPPSCCVVDSCGPGIQSSRGPKEPCGKAVVLKVSGLLDLSDDICNKPARVTVAPECDAAKPGDLDDPDHDIFILRIGKKGLVGAGEKSDIQLEMRTPKGPERRPPVRFETREMQTEDGGTGKKGKGKKKK